LLCSVIRSAQAAYPGEYYVIEFTDTGKSTIAIVRDVECRKVHLRVSLSSRWNVHRIFQRLRPPHPPLQMEIQIPQERDGLLEFSGSKFELRNPPALGEARCGRSAD
jgi:hypothetical protein